MTRGEINQNLSQALRTVDVASEAAHLSSSQSEYDRISAAIERAQDRVRDIIAALAEFKRDSGAIAEALLDGAAAADAAVSGPSREALEEERDALRAAIRDLGDRLQEARASVASAKFSLQAATGAATNRGMEDLMRMARQQARALAETMACVAALGHASNCHGDKSRAAAIILDDLMKARLLERQDAIDVPEDFREALKPIEAISGLDARIPAKIVPLDPTPLAFAAAARAGFGIVEAAH